MCKCVCGLVCVFLFEDEFLCSFMNVLFVLGSISKVLCLCI